MVQQKNELWKTYKPNSWPMLQMWQRLFLGFKCVYLRKNIPSFVFLLSCLRKTHDTVHSQTRQGRQHFLCNSWSRKPDRGTKRRKARLGSATHCMGKTIQKTRQNYWTTNKNIGMDKNGPKTKKLSRGTKLFPFEIIRIKKGFENPDFLIKLFITKQTPSKTRGLGSNGFQKNKVKILGSLKSRSIQQFWKLLVSQTHLNRSDFPALKRMFVKKWIRHK